MTDPANSSGQKPVLVTTLFPLGGNYGGLLQAYALQQVLASIGCLAVTNNSPAEYGRLGEVLRVGKRLVSAVSTRRRPTPHIVTNRLREMVWENTSAFMAREVRTVDFLGLSVDDRQKALEGYQAVVVGSDQVWRPRYTNVADQLAAYAYGSDITRISYAASFGIDSEAEYSDSLIECTRALAQEFAALSVREKSGQALTEKLWGRNSELHVDPTLLLTADHYRELADLGPAKRLPARYIASYVLDETPEWVRFMEGLSKETGLPVVPMLPAGARSQIDLMRHPKRAVLPPVEDWLNTIADAEFVVTDSFHGTAFSIVFKKQFITKINDSRGATRMENLLAMLGIPDRFVSERSTAGEARRLLEESVDWQSVSRALSLERVRSLRYLKGHLVR